MKAAVIAGVAVSVAAVAAGPDLVLENVVFTRVEDTGSYINYTFTYDLVNIGDAPVDLGGEDPTIMYDNVGVQTYLADSGAADGQLYPAGGSSIWNPVVLDPGARYAGVFTANSNQLPDPEHPGAFTWLVIDIHTTPETGAALDNNRVVVEIPEPCGIADVAPLLGQLDLSDVTQFLSWFLVGDPRADLNGDGLFDLADVVAFVGAFTAGCP